MARRHVLIAAALLVAGAALPLFGQQPGQAPGANPPRTKAPRTPGATAGKTLRPRQAPSGQPAAPVSPAAGAPTAPAAAQPTAGQPAAVVTPQAAQPTSPAAAPANAFTAGLGIPPFSGADVAARHEYLRTLARNLDSATVALVDLYRNTSGQPMAGATGPTALSARERERWTRCRNLYWDFNSLASGLQGIHEGITNASLARAASALDTALTELDALSECDNVSSMITAPERWDPWAEQYTNAARHFYTDWYGQVREAHERDRALVVALNAVLPAGRALPVPPGLPRNPPYAGAGVR
jgi:hypothetical protein